MRGFATAAPADAIVKEVKKAIVRVVGMRFDSVLSGSTSNPERVAGHLHTARHPHTLGVHLEVIAC